MLNGLTESVEELGSDNFLDIVDNLKIYTGSFELSIYVKIYEGVKFKVYKDDSDEGYIFYCFLIIDKTDLHSGIIKSRIIKFSEEEVALLFLSVYFSFNLDLREYSFHEYTKLHSDFLKDSLIGDKLTVVSEGMLGEDEVVSYIKLPFPKEMIDVLNKAFVNYKGDWKSVILKVLPGLKEFLPFQYGDIEAEKILFK